MSEVWWKHLVVLGEGVAKSSTCLSPLRRVWSIVSTSLAILNAGECSERIDAALAIRPTK